MIYLLRCDDEEYTAKIAEMLKDNNNVSVCGYDNWENFQSDIGKKKMESIFWIKTDISLLWNKKRKSLSA